METDMIDILIIAGMLILGLIILHLPAKNWAQDRTHIIIAIVIIVCIALPLAIFEISPMHLLRQLKQFTIF